MKKHEQYEVNSKVLKVYNARKDEIQNLRAYQTGERLRSCSATVIHGYDGFYLKSYHTIIGFIPYSSSFDYDMPCYDFLRYVYGYTATSAQHITKFARDYGNGTVLSWKGV